MRLRLLAILPLIYSGCDGPVSAQAGKNHRVQPGETLFSIAERAYGNGLEWRRIWEANPHLDYDRLPVGKTIYIPPREERWGDPPPTPDDYAASAGGGFEVETNRDPGYSAGRDVGSSGILVFHNLRHSVQERTLFGFPLERALLVVLICFALHGIIETVLVWIAAHLTFVKEVSFKKSARAVVMTETLTFTTLLVTLAVAILLAYLGTEPSGSAGSPLFPALESYLGTPAGAAVAWLGLLALYVVLSLRFLPQAFGVPLSHAVAVMTLAILLPHLLGFYLVGQRTGIIQ